MYRWLIFCVVIFFAPVASAQDSAKITKIVSTPLEVLGVEHATAVEEMHPVDSDIEWRVHVPKTYDPNVPAGVLVYISPSNSGRLPKRWKKPLDEANVIYIAANDSGNEVAVNKRMLFATLAVDVANQNFNIDRERIYISGFSGGGRVASFMSALFPGTFNGGLYIGGVEYKTQADPHPDFYKGRHVLLTGHNDFNRKITKAAFEKMTTDGASAHLMDIPNLGHELPRANHLATAIAFLDAKE